MELLTDILAIAGWALFGWILPFLIFIASGEKEIVVSSNWGFVVCSLSFGLIAASLVLG